MPKDKEVTSFKVKWLKQQFDKLRMVYSPEELSNEEIKKILLEAYSEKKNPTGRFFNNVTKENKAMTLENYINYFLNNDYILTGYNALIKNQHAVRTISIEALETILNKRSEYKKKQQESEKGSTAYTHNKVVQQTYKILANSYYGIISMPSSPFYNPVIQNSITQGGWDSISSAIYFIEAFTANNEKFDSFNSMLSFISNVCKETYIISDKLDANKTLDDVKKRLLNSTTAIDIDEIVLSKTLSRCNQEQLNKLYYKNNLIELLSNTWFKTRLIDGCINNTENPEFRDAVVDACQYNQIAWDRFIRISHQTRQASIVTDTDSTFLYLGKLVPQIQKLINDYSGDVKLNICNILIYIVTEGLKRTMWKFTGNCNIPESHRPILNLKNEFLYNRLLTTKNKKSYAGWLLSELGKAIPGDDPDKHLDMKGLAIRKTTTAKSLRSKFQDMLINDILLPDKVNVLQVMKDYNTISKHVEDSIKSGKTEFLLPKAVKQYTKYINPASTEQVKATMIWNSIEGGSNTIVPPANIKLIKVKGRTPDTPEMLAMAKLNKEKYNKIKETVFETKQGELDLSKNGFTALAVPLDLEEIPDYIKPVIDYEYLVNSNVKNANILLDSLGLQCTEDKVKKTNHKSNIIEWI